MRRETDLRWPGRSKASDGWIGDPSHAARKSDHNPDAEGIVRALDVTLAGINLPEFLVAVTHHPATHYVIARRRIWSRDWHWASRPYEGPDPHLSHVHVSILPTAAAAANTRSWRLAPQ